MNTINITIPPKKEIPNQRPKIYEEKMQQNYHKLQKETWQQQKLLAVIFIKQQLKQLFIKMGELATKVLLLKL